MSTGVNMRLASEPHQTVRLALTCSTPELSRRVYAIRADFQRQMWRGPASHWHVKEGLQDIIWKKHRAILKNKG
jgi:hypothetical protein